MGLEDPKLLLRCMAFDAQSHAICVLLFKVEHVLFMSNCVKWLLSFEGTLFNQFLLGVAISSLILSLTADVMYISVFPGFWKWIPMIHMQELLMTASAAYVNSLSM